MQVVFYLSGEITQVLDAIPWVRCASGNVLVHILLYCFGPRTVHHDVCELAAKEARAKVPKNNGYI